jgi:hypothetical protein
MIRLMTLGLCLGFGLGLGMTGLSAAEGDQSIDAAVQAQLFAKPPATGALVTTVTADSEAKTAGLQPGDIITTYDGKPVDSAPSLPLLCKQVPPTTIITITVVRNGQPVTIPAHGGRLGVAISTIVQGAPAPSRKPNALPAETPGAQCDLSRLSPRPFVDWFTITLNDKPIGALHLAVSRAQDGIRWGYEWAMDGGNDFGGIQHVYIDQLTTADAHPTLISAEELTPEDGTKIISRVSSGDHPLLTVESPAASKTPPIALPIEKGHAVMVSALMPAVMELMSLDKDSCLHVWCYQGRHHELMEMALHVEDTESLPELPSPHAATHLEWIPLYGSPSSFWLDKPGHLVKGILYHDPDHALGFIRSTEKEALARVPKAITFLTGSDARSSPAPKGF